MLMADGLKGFNTVLNRDCGDDGGKEANAEPSLNSYCRSYPLTTMIFPIVLLPLLLVPAVIVPNRLRIVEKT